MRKTSEELQALMEEQHADRLWSWSKANMYKSDPYSYMLKYIKKIEADKQTNAYAYLGGIVHDLLERFYEGELDNEGMIKEFEDKVILQELSGIKFDSNEGRNITIGNRYKTCIKHFLKEYEKDEDAKLEQFVYGKIGGHLFQGYIDKMHIKDNILYIDDFKTSTMYKGEKIDNEKGQLLLYAILINQMQPKITFDKINVRWNFLKYAAIDCEQVNGNITTTYSERNEIGQKLEAKMRTWLKKEKLSTEEIDEYIQEVKYRNETLMLDKGCLDCLPENVKKKFTIRDCTVGVELDQFSLQNFTIMLTERCNQIIKKEELYAMSEDENLFWVNITDKNSYYFVNLCDYSAKYHIPLKKYYETIDKMNSKFDKSKDSLINDLIFGDLND